MVRSDFNEDWYFSSDGKTFRKLNLPHDAMLETARKKDSPSGSGEAYFQGGSYVYTKTFDKPSSESALLQFGGVYKNAKVYLNGELIKENDYGYLPFFVRLDGHLREGKNELRVECENKDQPDSRWYSGAGIYRPVYLWTGKEHPLLPESVRITTLSVDPVRIRVGHTGGLPLSVKILDGEKEIYEGKDGEIGLNGVSLWDENSPKLYTCIASYNGDELSVKFGIRKIEISNRGLFVNGKKTLLRGGCLHADNGILGSVSFKEAEYRKAKLLKEAGFNAIRSAHNPLSPDLLDACDELGIYVMDEMWDMWYYHKSRYDYASVWEKNYEDDIRAVVSRDYNRPSVILYSIGNEISEPAKKKGVEKGKEIANLFRSLDPTRFVTAGINLMILTSAYKGKGMYDEKEGGKKDKTDTKLSGLNSTLFNMITNFVGPAMNNMSKGKKTDRASSPFFSSLDVCGYNYASGRYRLDGKKHPERVIVGSETFPYDIVKNWRYAEELPYLIGDFMWTAVDYLGEVGIGAWAYTKDAHSFEKPYPWLLADTGAYDILFHPTGEAFMAQAAWHRLDKPAISVRPLNHGRIRPTQMVWRGTNSVPSWSWKGCEGKKATVEVYAEGAYAVLYLNGKKAGKKKLKDKCAKFRLAYKPGKLEAVAYHSDGTEWGRNELVSASKEDLHILAPSSVRTGERFAVRVYIGDEKTVESNADRTVRVSISNGDLLAFGSAIPRTEESFLSGTYTTYYGNALMWVRAGKKGILKIRAGEKETEVRVL